MSVRIVDVELPEHPHDGSAAADLFRGFVDVRNRVRREAWGGSADLDFSVRESFSAAQMTTEYRLHSFVALNDDEVVGYARLEVSVPEPDAPAQLILGVLPAFRRRGIGSALFARIEEAIRAEGRRATQLWVEHPDQDGPSLVPTTGFGSVPAADPGAIALTRAGFSLEQAERISRLDVPDADVLEREQQHAQAAAAGYRLQTWSGQTPAELLDTMAALGARMSTDAPAGGLDTVEEVWDAERLAAYEQNEIVDQGRQYLTAAAFDADGSAVAFTKLLLPATATRQAIQQDTLVHADHRGRQLGMLVKIANLLQLVEAHPEIDRVITWNAEENRHMLAVNERIGFRPVMTEGAWQRKEAPA